MLGMVGWMDGWMDVGLVGGEGGVSCDVMEGVGKGRFGFWMLYVWGVRGLEREFDED